MSKISELGSITGANTRTEDLFVIVNLVQGDDGTKNITRKELVQALMYEIFNRITITGGDISGAFIHDLNIDNVKIDNSDMEDSNIVRTDFNNGTLRNSTGTNLDIDNSLFRDGDIRDTAIVDSTFNDGSMENVDGDNVRLINSTIDDSAIGDSTANNVTITNSSFASGTMADVDGTNVRLTNSTFANGEITDSTADNVTITNSTFDTGAITNSTIDQSEFTNGAITSSTGDDLTITTSSFADGTIENSTANNVTITQSDILDSDFSDGTGNNNIFTNTTVDQSIIQNSTIVDSSFAGTMDGVVATNMSITSSTADGLSQKNSTFDNGVIENTTFKNGVIDQSKLVDFDMEIDREFEPHIDENSWFALKNEKTGEVEKITYAQFFSEISKTTESDLKIYVDAAKGNDENPGSLLEPIRTLERASELALEKAGGSYDRNAINNAIHITVGPGTYYTKGNIALPDDCAMTATAGQYATVIEALPGYENNNAVLVGSGCYVQGFAYQNWKIDNFDFPEGGFACAYRPGAKLLRSPYIRDSSQLSNFLREDVEPPLQPFNTKGNVLDLGREFILTAPITAGTFRKDDKVTFSSGATGFISWDDDDDDAAGLTKDQSTYRKIRVRNLKNNKGFAVGDLVKSESGGQGVVESIGIDDFPNPLVGRGGGCMLADRRVLDPDSLYTYVLCFGFTPRSQNGMGYVARDGAGVNGIGSLSIFVRVAFYALNGGQMTLNNSGTQFGDISMRAKGSTRIFAPKDVPSGSTIIGNTDFADVITQNEDLIIEDMVDYLTANTSSGGLGYTGYDAQKCERDSKIIIDGLAYDMTLDTNYWGRLAGITYRSPISSKVVGEQLDATLGANRYLQDRINDIFDGANTEIFERANTSWNELYNVVEYGEENMNPIIFADTRNSKRTSAREIIQDNRSFIQDELLDWIDNNDQFFAYDSVKCKRDTTDYILPAAKYDMLLDTNYNAVRAGGAYYMKSAEKVVGQQRNETIAAYRRLKEQTNELIDANSYIGTSRVDAAFDEVIAALDNRGVSFTPTNATYDPETGYSVITIAESEGFTPSAATYDPATGILVATIGPHQLTTDDHVWLKPEGMTFNCNAGSGVQNHAVPEAHHPYYNKPCPIISVTSNTITMNVGGGGPNGQQVHTFVSAVKNAITSGHGLGIGQKVLLKTGGLVISCDRDNNVSRTGYPRATDPAANSPIEVIGANETKITVNVGKSFDTSAHTFIEAEDDSVITLGSPIAFSDDAGISADRRNARKQLQLNRNFLQDNVMGYIDDNYFLYDSAKCERDMLQYILPAIQRDIITGTNFNSKQTGIAYRAGTQGAETVVMDQLVETVGAINHLKGLSSGTISDQGAIDRSDEGFDQIVDILNNNQKSYTPTGATYDPTTGVMVLTLGAHDLQEGDTVVLADESITFTCALDGNTTQHSYPTTTKTKYTPTNATYDPTTGVFTATIGTHNLQVGDHIKIAPESIVFTCDMDGNATNHPTPESHHPFYKKPVALTAVTSTTITCNVGAAINGGGTHTFVSALADAIEGERQHPAYRTPITINSTTSTTITVNVGGYENGTAHTFVSANPDSVKSGTYISSYTPSTATYDPATGVFEATIGRHNLAEGDYVQFKPESIVFSCTLDGNSTNHAVPESHHPFYNAPVRITAVTSTSITMNVGASTGGAHTFVSADVGAIESDPTIWTDPSRILKYYTPSTATYNPVNGVSVITIPNHDIVVGDWIEFAPYSFTFTCAQDGNATEHSYPRRGDANFNAPMEVTNVAGDDITVNSGIGGGGAHTFVRCINQAVAKTTYNSHGQRAREQLQANRTFLQEEVMHYLDSQYFVFDGDKCSRDTGFILEAVRRDVATGSNYNAIYSGLAYRAGTASGNYVISDQLTQTAAAIGYIRDEVANRLDGTELAASNASFNEIIDILTNGTGAANAINYGTATAGADAGNAQLHLQANKTFLQEEVIAYITQNFPNLSYDAAKCRRDTGYLIDALSWDIAHRSNAGVVNFARLYFNEGVSVLPADQKIKTAEAWEHLANVVALIVRAQAVTPTTGNAEAQDTTNPDAGDINSIRTHDLIEVVSKVIREDTLDWLPTYIEPGYTTAATLDASNKIDGITESLQGGVIKYLREFHNGLPYNKDKCFRDVGLITDAVSKDIEYGGNASTIEAAKYYFTVDERLASSYEELRTRNVLSVPVTGQFSVLDDLAAVSGLREATNILPIEQRVPTKRAFEHLATVAQSVVQETPYATTYTTYSPTNATYDPATGVFTATIGAHSFQVGGKVWLKPNGFTFQCDMGSGPTNHTSPQAHHPYYDQAVTITAVTATEITMNVGDGGSGQAVHTFVSADADSISTGPYQNFDNTAADSTTAAAVRDLFNVISGVVDDNDLDNLTTTEVKPVADPNRTVARKQIQRNKEFIVDEVVAYLNDEFYTFDGDKCKRDVGLLVDAVKRDVLTGSNFNANFNGRAYRIGTVGADAVINEQLTETISAVEYAKLQASNAVTDDAANQRVNAAFDTIINIMGGTEDYANANTMSFGTDAVSAQRINARAQLQNNKVFLQKEMTAWIALNRPSLSYDVAKCERDVGYLVDSVSFDAQHGGNTASRNNAILYFENALSVLPENQREPTAAAFTHLASVAELIANGDPVSPTSGNGESQDTSAASAGNSISAVVEQLMLIVAEAIGENGIDGLPVIEEPTVSSYGTAFQGAYTALETTKPTIQNGVLGHLSTYFNTLSYDETKCRRDTGYIVDAVMHDIQYGGNAATVNAAYNYFQNGVNVGLPLNQRQPANKAFLHLGKVMNHITREMVVTPTVGNTRTQDFAEVAANPMTGMRVEDLVKIVANAVDDATPETTSIPAMVMPETDWILDVYKDSINLIENASENLADQVISFISTTYNGLSFPRGKCRRDVGYLIDAVSHDVQYGGNYATRIAAGIYFENGISVLPADTRTQTADIYNFLGARMSDVVQQIDVAAANTSYTDTRQVIAGTAATATEGASAQSLTGIIESVIRNDSLNGLPVLEEPDTSWIAADLIATAEMIEDNKQELAQDLIHFLHREFDVLDYNKDKCRRDTGYLLDAFSYDLNYGGNTASRWNADFYFWNEIYRIPEDQRVPTARSYQHLGRICKDIVLGRYPGQMVKSGTGTEVEANKVEDLANIFYLTQINNDTTYLPAIEEPDYTWIPDVVKDVSSILEFNKIDLAFDTVRFVNATYQYIDINLTRRDGLNLLKAIRQDFSTVNPAGPPLSDNYQNNGDRQRTRAYTAALFDFDGQHVFPVFNPTTTGLKYMGSVSNNTTALAEIQSRTGDLAVKKNHAYIVATDINNAMANTSGVFTGDVRGNYAGDVYYWNGATWINDGPNNVDLLNSFVQAWAKMRDYLVTLAPDNDHRDMVKALINWGLIDNVMRPETLVFGSLVESIAHQFNGASAGVNRNALPLNFRNLGLPISALASVLSEDGGRVRWSGADELNNQYFARGLRINGRTGRIEGRPFTSSVRKLARRASNSRASI